MNEGRSYRPNVGIAVFDRRGRVLIARRIGDDGPEIVTRDHRWQMPQGGVEPGEDLERAARRELEEETAITSVAILGRMADPISYDFPPYAGPPHRLAAFEGQTQTWFAMRFLGQDDEIDVARAAPGVPPEFDDWRWEHLDRVAELVVPFRRTVYRRVARDFATFAVPARTAG